MTYDEFNDTDAVDLEDHTPDGGGTWEPFTGTPGMEIGVRDGVGYSDEVKMINHFSGCRYYIDTVIASENYKIKATLVMHEGQGWGNGAGLFLRSEPFPASNVHAQAYEAIYRCDLDEWQIHKWSGASDPNEDGEVQASDSWSSGIREVEFWIEDDTLYLKVDGVVILEWTDPSPISITGVGGITFTGGYASGITFSYFELDDDTGEAPVKAVQVTSDGELQPRLLN